MSKNLIDVRDIKLREIAKKVIGIYKKDGVSVAEARKISAHILSTIYGSTKV